MIRLWFASIATASLLGASLFAQQTTGTITGRVQDRAAGIGAPPRARFLRERGARRATFETRRPPMTTNRYHPSWSEEAQAAFEGHIAAHGGFEAWEALRVIEFEPQEVGGFLLALKGLGRTCFAPRRIVAHVKERRVELFNLFPHPLAASHFMPSARSRHGLASMQFLLRWRCIRRSIWYKYSCLVAAK